MDEFDVVVVGAGPTGSTAAGDLARRGRRVAVVERWPSRHPGSRAFAVMPRTLEMLAHRTVEGRPVTETLLGLGTPVPRVRLWHGAAIRLDRLDTAYPHGLVVPQTHVDRLLEDRAREAGATVLRGHEVVGLEQDDTGVELRTAPHDGGPVRSLRARYVVAADGSRSTVRELLGVEFPGRSVLSSVVLADVRLAAPPAGEGLTLGGTREEFGFLAPYGDDRYRSMTWSRSRQLPDDAPVDDDEIGPVLARALGRDVGVTAVDWRSRFHCDERQVARYRHGRVLLAGDAAHVHSPMGGQGMNTGIQDAANLGWKLDAVLGGADDAVLDTYHDERHPIGRRVLLQSGLMMRAITLHPRPARAVRDVVSTRLLASRAGNAAIAGSFAGTGLRYRSGPGDHRLVGTPATRVPLAEGTVGDRDDVGFLLVRAAGTPPEPGAPAQAERRGPGPSLLVRPDGYVAWAGHDDGWCATLARWTGTRAVAAR
ncbi:FAD-dependent oxidoreductase [Actinomycetospora termitidis]|uniref:FAD-dependent monooxygenase n=1 Tax=Actinomycetospora termitidis TaxID=3053470 RepID=A0ABT7M3E6_9PSEU|nr:FAD-dependent oxidoreductase [Actinomycetospora sp. Odt1-22]MDL5155180.1 FAD-dependent monooxygenase [Actinomycetospora sp. Odt1-22]